MPKDPVCGMEVDESKVLKAEKNGKIYFFCSRNCQDRFLGIKENKAEAQEQVTSQNKAVINVTDMHCGSCVATIENALKKTPGVISAKVNFAIGKAYIEYDPEKTSQSDLHQAIELSKNLPLVSDWKHLTATAAKAVLIFKKLS